MEDERRKETKGEEEEGKEGRIVLLEDGYRAGLALAGKEQADKEQAGKAG